MPIRAQVIYLLAARAVDLRESCGAINTVTVATNWTESCSVWLIAYIEPNQINNTEEIN
jgi:hypothetical protein